MGWSSKKHSSGKVSHFNDEKVIRSSEPNTELNIEIDNNSDDFSEGVRDEFERIKENQKIMIKFPTEKPTLMLNDAVVYVDPVLKFEGRLKDGRGVVHDKNNEWVYYV